MMEELPDHLLCDVISRLHFASDRNAASLVSTRFYELERKQRWHLKVGCGLHPFHSAVSSLCSRFPHLSKVEVGYSGWMSKFGKQLDDEGLNIIANRCPNLIDLSLSFCTFITDVGLSNLAVCNGLKALRLNFIPGITGRGLLSLVTGCRSLSLLHLTFCIHVNSVEWLYFLGHRGKVEDLAICKCRGIGEGDLAKLGQGWRTLRNLQFQVDANYRYMKVYGHLAVDRWQVQEVNCESLEELSLTNCLICPGRGLACVLSKCRALRKLHLDMCVGVRDEDLIDLAKISTGLRSVSLKVPSDFSFFMLPNNPPRLTDESLKAFGRHCHFLEEVCISFSDGAFPFFSCFSLAGILALVEECCSLKVLVLERVYSFSDRGMEALCAAHSLEALELLQCQEVSDEGIRLMRHLPCLKRIRICRCLGITDAGLAALLASPKLESLEVEDCPQISEKGTHGIAKEVFYKQDLSWMYL